MNSEQIKFPIRKSAASKKINFYSSGRSSHYDSKVGHWTTKDPIGFAGGDTNLYAYVGGNPMSYVDPSGLNEQDVINIENQFNSSVDFMNNNGLRRQGSGLMSGILNNLSIARNKRLVWRYHLFNLFYNAVPKLFK